MKQSEYSLDILTHSMQFSGLKRPEREAYRSPPSTDEVKNARSYTSTPQYAYIAWCSVKKGTWTTLLLPVTS